MSVSPCSVFVFRRRCVPVSRSAPSGKVFRLAALCFCPLLSLSANGLYRACGGAAADERTAYGDGLVREFHPLPFSLPDTVNIAQEKMIVYEKMKAPVTDGSFQLVKEVPRTSLTKRLRFALRLGCPPHGVQFDARSTRCVFVHVHAAPKTHFSFFRVCGRETLRGLFDSLKAPVR